MSWENILKREVGPTGEFVPRYWDSGPPEEPEYRVIEYYIDKSGNRQEFDTKHLLERPSIKDIKNSESWKGSIEDFYAEYDDAGHWEKQSEKWIYPDPDTWRIKGLGFDIKQGKSWETIKVIDSFYLPMKDLVEEAERLQVTG